MEQVLKDNEENKKQIFKLNMILKVNTSLSVSKSSINNFKLSAEQIMLIEKAIQAGIIQNVKNGASKITLVEEVRRPIDIHINLQNSTLNINEGNQGLERQDIALQDRHAERNEQIRDLNIGILEDDYSSRKRQVSLRFGEKSVNHLSNYPKPKVLFIPKPIAYQKKKGNSIKSVPAISYLKINDKSSFEADTTKNNGNFSYKPAPAFNEEVALTKRNKLSIRIAKPTKSISSEDNEVSLKRVKQCSDMEINKDNNIELPLPIKGQKEEEKGNEWAYETLCSFLNKYYLKNDCDLEMLKGFNQKEKLILLRFVATKKISKSRAMQDMAYLTDVVKEFFLQDPKQIKGYKVTNSKRFIYRKVKAVMYHNFKQEGFRKHFGKRKTDNEFMKHYFYSNPIYDTLSKLDKITIEELFRIYEESKVSILWRFENFKQDFTAVLFNFKDEIERIYYRPKLSNLKNFLESINDKDLENVRRTKLPFLTLPVIHSIIDLYTANFMEAFKRSLV